MPEFKPGDRVQIGVDPSFGKITRLIPGGRYEILCDDGECLIPWDHVPVKPIPPSAPSFDGLLAWARANLPEGWVFAIYPRNVYLCRGISQVSIFNNGTPSQQLIAAVQHARREAGLEPAEGPCYPS